MTAAFSNLVMAIVVRVSGDRQIHEDVYQMDDNGVDAPVSSAGAQGTLVGVDQATVSIPRSLAGSGTVDLVLTAAGQAANTVRISFQ